MKETSREPYYEGYIASYEKWLAAAPYVREVMARLMPLLGGAESMLDIGAGTGAISLAAPPCVKVTAVESSPAMLETFAAHARKAGRDVRIIAEKWETADIAERAYDVVLCANAVYSMEPLADSLAKMVRAARRAVLIVMNGRTEIGTYGKMRQALKATGIPCGAPPDVYTLGEVKDALGAIGAVYETSFASWTDEVHFADKDEVMRYLSAKLRFTLSEDAERVLMPHLTEDAAALVLKNDMTMAFLTVRV